ncbi:hypothetical protein SK128_003061 [Halocaridina rubra]|uniref:Heparan sulfate 2-O-sulfotransferase pipe n=1 Tax=Halocaridina rubra TaxID=373956 RepID=A0AAN8ZZC4_HALRR
MTNSGMEVKLRKRRRLSSINGFTYSSSYNYKQWRLPRAEQLKLEEQWYNATRTRHLSYDKHFYFFDLKRFPENEVAWINMVRDPIDRFISYFYYKRLKLLKSEIPMAYSYYELQLDDCTPKGDPECLPRPGDIMALQLTFFCGQHPHCRIVGNRWALQQAKANVLKSYPVIGLAEDVQASLYLFEHYFPEFFKNRFKIQNGSGDEKINTRPEIFSPNVSANTRSLLRNSLEDDIEFYDFVRQRFYTQFTAVTELKRGTTGNLTQDNT